MFCRYVEFYLLRSRCQVEFYIVYNPDMPKAEVKLTHTSAMILQAIRAGVVYGYTIMDATGFPSGTVYPALRRMENEGLIRSQWEKPSATDELQGPLRKFYKVTAEGKLALAASYKRYPLLAKLVPDTPGGRA